MKTISTMAKALIPAFSLLALLVALEAAGSCGLGYVWYQQVLSPAPPLNDYMTMTYDKSRGQAVLLRGGYETWTFNGFTWRRLSPAHTPGLSESFQMAYDEWRGVVVALVTKTQPDPRMPRLEVWEWDGTDWTNVPESAPWPPGVSGFGMAYDTRRGKHVLFGGEVPVNGQAEPIGETWEYDGELRGWQLRATSGPAPRPPAGMVFDQARGVTLMVGGKEAEPYYAYDDTWAWDGLVWSQKASLPAFAVKISLVYDEFNQVVWAWGAGNPGSSYQGRTWAWNGTEYRCHLVGDTFSGLCSFSPGPAPSLLLGTPPQLAPSAYDPSRLRVVALDRNTNSPQSATYFLVRGVFVALSNPSPLRTGSKEYPFVSVQEAIPCITNGSTLLIQSGTYDEFEPITINRRVDIVPLGGSVTIR